MIFVAKTTVTMFVAILNQSYYLAKALECFRNMRDVEKIAEDRAQGNYATSKWFLKNIVEPRL